MRVYITGPVTGLPNDNREAFELASRAVRKSGHEAIVPHEVVPSGTEWLPAMRLCIRAMMDAEALLALIDWEESRGASAEVCLAAALGIPVFYSLAELRAASMVSSSAITEGAPR